MTDRINGENGRAALDPAVQQFVDSLPTGPAFGALSSADARAFLLGLQSAPVGKPSASIQDLTFPVGPTGEVPVRIVRPRADGGAIPAVVYFHGGGRMSGDASTHDRLMREIAVGAGAAIVFVDYDRVPDAAYPIALEQAYAATKYLAEHSRELAVDGARLAVIGDGVGGNLATAVTLAAKQRRGPTIELQILLYPATDADCRTHSYTAFADGPWLTRAAMRGFWDAYLPDPAQRRAVTAAPLNATVDELRDLPDALILVAENDVVRDEGEAYARKLADAGVRVTSVRYNGTIHDFLLLNALADTAAVRSAIAQIVSALRAAFG